MMFDAIRRIIRPDVHAQPLARLAQLRRDFPRDLFSTSKKRVITRPLPNPLLLSQATEGDCWIHLATLEQLSFGAALTVAEKFKRTNKRGGRIEFAAIRQADDAEHSQLGTVLVGVSFA